MRPRLVRLLQPTLLALLGAPGAAPIGAQSATFASLGGASGLPVQRFEIDWPHSAVEFTVRFMGLSNVRGAFAEFGGTIMYDTVDVTRSSVFAVINAASINTNVAMRDKDLRSENFFDVANHPLITFRSTTIEGSGEGFIARGPLTMHGVTREVAIPFTQSHKPEKDAWGNLRMGFLGHLILNRKDYGILGTKFWNSEYDPGRMSISDEVAIDLNIEGEVNNVERWETPRGDSLLKAGTALGFPRMLAEFRTAATDTASARYKAGGQMLNAAGVKLMHRGQFGDAVVLYRSVADLHPTAAWAHAALGEAYLMSGNRSMAIASFDRAVSLDSTNTVAAEYLRRLKPPMRAKSTRP